MEENILTKKDVTRGVIILALTLVGIPLTLLGLSNLREEHMYKTASEKIERGLRTQLTAGQRLYDAYRQEEEIFQQGWLLLPDYNNDRLFWSHVPQSELEYVQSDVCRTLADEIKEGQGVEDFLLDYSSYKADRYNAFCVLRIMEGPVASMKITYQGLEISSLKNNQEYLDDIKRLLASPEPHPVLLHIHKPEKEIHAQALISRDPVVFWDLVFRQVDR